VGGLELLKTYSNNTPFARVLRFTPMYYSVSVLIFTGIRPQHQAGLLLGDASLLLFYSIVYFVPQKDWKPPFLRFPAYLPYATSLKEGTHAVKLYSLGLG
jgi:hypothetical protein